MIHPLLRKTLKCISTGLLVSLTTLPATAQEDDTTLQKNYEKLQSQFEQLSGDMAKLQSQIKKQESSLDRKIEDKLAA